VAPKETSGNALSEYDRRALTVCSIGSHSALDVCFGAKKEGLRTLVIAAKGRERTYGLYYRGRPDGGCVDETIVLDHFADILKPEIQLELVGRNAIFVPNRSFEVYLRERYSYDEIEAGMRAPMFGARRLLRAEERDEPDNQYKLMDNAGIRYPRRRKGPQDIDSLTVVKAPHAKVPFERAFFLVSSPKEYAKRAGDLLSRGIVTEEGLAGAVFEEFVMGPTVNLNFFWSPMLAELELMGTDTRRQTNIDGVRALLASEQAALGEDFIPGMEEAGHIATTLTESMLEKAFDLGDRFVRAAYGAQPPGIIGPFALQCVIASGPPKSFVVYDVSLRIPGSPGTKYTPYSAYRWGREMSMGERIAKEIAMARDANRLGDVCT
jgi:5-formaminoimidazole-4-carboxamide-1-(beta)-D-ribofuranosyl 5'-monophosphate synthetase